MSDEYLEHYGTPRHSGRYPWGSGKDSYQRNANFLSYVRDLKKQGIKEKDIAKGLGMSTTELRAKVTNANNEKRAADIATAVKLKNKQMSNMAIARQMGINESQVRNLLKPSTQERVEVATKVMNALKDRVDSVDYVDVGLGTESYLNVSRTKLNASLDQLKDKGYVVTKIQVEQLGTNGNKTTVQVLAKPGTTYKELVTNKDKIKMISDMRLTDQGEIVSSLGVGPIKSVKSSRIYVRDGDNGGKDKDGIIELRKGVDDISLGNAHYAQVRIAVNGTHYLKGMALYSDDIPDGYDIVVNSNKPSGKSKIEYFKEMKKDSDGNIDKDNPFGATIKTEKQLKMAQKYYTDANGKKQTSAINIVNEDGDWDTWSRSLSAQMLGKQSPTLAKKQLDLAYSIKKAEYDEIASLTNPAVKKRLLQSFADDCDASAVHLKAAALPRQSAKVILPLTKIKDTEVYAPSYKNGETVVLIRYPHGGKFEIPELVVNNNNRQGKSILGNAKDAIGINSKVAERLSGADFDGDTVIVIPNNNRAIKTSAALEGLKNFDPKESYPAYPGMKTISARTKQIEMGKVSNLITDMTLKGASNDEICRAVRHSMVVIDSEKHKLNYKQSYIDNGIAELKDKYQNNGGNKRGASTLISRSKSEIKVNKRRMGYDIDPDTGEKIYRETGETYTDKKGRTVYRTQNSTRMAETKDARTLSSGTVMEGHYATYANKMKALGNTARKEMVSTKSTTYSPEAAKIYAKEVASLKSHLAIAIANKPLERQAQLIANTVVAAKKESNPELKEDREALKKVKAQALAAARVRTGASKQQIKITKKEWEAIQAGAITNNTLVQILNNTDLDKIKELATPRTKTGVNASKLSKARQMLANGYDSYEVADALGISVATLNRALEGKE
jgi:DNA-binding CsgD family transcriptional regulator